MRLRDWLIDPSEAEAEYERIDEEARRAIDRRRTTMTPTIAAEIPAKLARTLAAIAEEYGVVPRIEGPGSPDEGWVVYLANEVPCVCDDFESAADMMREHLGLQRVTRRRARKQKRGKR
jgi:hypothetical protein